MNACNKNSAITNLLFFAFWFSLPTHTSLTSLPTELVIQIAFLSSGKQLFYPLRAVCKKSKRDVDACPDTTFKSLYCKKIHLSYADLPSFFLLDAIDKNHIYMVKRILCIHGEKNLEIDLIKAIRRGRKEIVKILLKDKRADVNEGDEFGVTPIYSAASYGDLELFELILHDERIEDINKPNIWGYTPLSVASSVGHTCIVKALLNDERKVDVNQRDRMGKTALYEAQVKRNDDIVELLKNAGALEYTPNLPFFY